MTSDHPGLQGMATSRDAPNPLRPYYIPPSIGNTYERPNITGSAPTSGLGLGKSARDLFSDIEYGNPLLDRDGPGFTEVARKIADQALWKYTSVLLAQPFDVAKTILQVRMAEEADYTPDSVVKPRRTTRVEELHSDSDSDPDSPSFFTPTKPGRGQDDTPSRRRSPRGRNLHRSTRSSSATPVPIRPHPAHQLRIRQPDSVLEVLGSLWTQSGATGLWKATNATFLYNVFVRALESWTRGMLSALANLPDPGSLGTGPGELVATAMGGVDVIDSPSPLASLAVAVAASAIAGLVLAPLDLVRTRLIITPTTLPPRGTFAALRSLPSLLPPSLVPITLLHSALPSLLTSSLPLLLRTHLHIDPLTTPTTYGVTSFLTSTAELLIKLPLETLLRRAQVSALATQQKDLRTVVAPGPYRGIFGTVYSIVYEEGHRRPTELPSLGTGSVSATPVKLSAAPVRERKRGQGLSGLVRGWRVGMWGLCGVWLAAAMNSQNQGGEF